MNEFANIFKLIKNSETRVGNPVLKSLTCFRWLGECALTPAVITMRTTSTTTKPTLRCRSSLMKTLKMRKPTRLENKALTTIITRESTSMMTPALNTKIQRQAPTSIMKICAEDLTTSLSSNERQRAKSMRLCWLSQPRKRSLSRNKASKIHSRVACISRISSRNRTNWPKAHIVLSRRTDCLWPMAEEQAGQEELETFFQLEIPVRIIWNKHRRESGLRKSRDEEDQQRTRPKVQTMWRQFWISITKQGEQAQAF